MSAGAVRGSILSDEGQMAVELAVLIPVVLVVALTVYNLGRFVQLCAAFDQVSLDAIVSQGVSPPGEQTTLSATESIRSVVEDALPGDDFEIRVSASGGAEGGGTTFSLSALQTRYTCTLEYRPWPHSFVIAGVPFEAPVKLHHERSLVVDRFKSGVVV